MDFQSRRKVGTMPCMGINLSRHMKLNLSRPGVYSTPGRQRYGAIVNRRRAQSIGGSPGDEVLYRAAATDVGWGRIGLGFVAFLILIATVALLSSVL